MAGGMGWSVIIPSRDGEDTLPRCLASITGFVRPAEGVEIILVDNGSVDSTANLMHEFAASFAAVVLSEPRHGKSYALNAAMERAQGDMILFLDDDAIADAGLLCAYAQARRDFPDAGVLAGRVLPNWPARPPAWLQSLASEGLSCGCTPERMTADWISAMHVKGANMCFSRAAIGDSRFALREVNFGAGTRRVGGLDTEFARRVGASGRIRFVPEAKVQHIIGLAEMTWRSAFSRYLRIGRNNAAQDLTGPGLSRLMARSVVYSLLAICAFAVGARTAAARFGVRAAMQFGALDYLLRRRAAS